MMKLYEFKDFPNPRRVRIFLSEKGIGNVSFVQVDLPSGEHRTEAFKNKNPFAGVPVLELDDGTCISETIAISRYFEEKHPEPFLMGKTPQEKAEIEMLHTYQTEHVPLVRWERGTQFMFHSHPGGEEIFVLEGVFEDEFGRYPKGTWLRNPPGSIHTPFSCEGCLIYVKTGHLKPTDGYDAITNELREGVAGMM